MYLHPKPKQPIKSIGRTKPSPYTLPQPGAPEPVLVQANYIEVPHKSMSVADTMLPNIAEKPDFLHKNNHLKPKSMYRLQTTFSPPHPKSKDTPTEGLEDLGETILGKDAMSDSLRPITVTRTRDGLLYFPETSEKFGCPYPSCGARFTRAEHATQHYRFHTTKSIVHSTSEADAYFLRMWDSVGLNTMIKHDSLAVPELPGYKPAETQRPML
jgi:hypothetical protein